MATFFLILAGFIVGYFIAKIFGCWGLWAERGAENDADLRAKRDVTKVFCDGMEFVLSGESSPRESMSGPYQWTEEYSEKVGEAGDEIGAAELYLLKRIA